MSALDSLRGLDEKQGEAGVYYDVEAGPIEAEEPSEIAPLSVLPQVLRQIVSYPAADQLPLRSTSWLDGVRGVAALEVYIFHAMGCWAALVPGWHADENQQNMLQLPVLRTFFVAGGAAVSVFFALSGYVLTYKSLRWIREGSTQHLYRSVASSMFRRGFRLYLPPIFMTFVEMVASRFGRVPPLNFTFVAESTARAQFVDWMWETNRLVNPLHNMYRALHGFITHPKYETVIWTIPLEFYGSFMCYFLLIGLSRVRNTSLRMTIIAFSSLCFMLLGSWNMFCFAAGMLIADFNLGQDDTPIRLPARHISTLPWMVLFAAAFYAAGLPTFMFPDSYAKPMPGFETLRNLTPTGLYMEDHARFWWSLAGASLLLSISQLPQLRRLFETHFCQYLGKISFALYLVHEFCLSLFGLGMKRTMLELAGMDPDARGESLEYWLLCLAWLVGVSVPVFGVAAQVERWVDGPSVQFARWLEGNRFKKWTSWR